MKALEPGKLDKKITIQKPDPASPKDSAGQRVTNWLDVAVNIWASIEPVSGRAEFIAAQTQASTTHIVKCWRGPRLTMVDATHRVLFGSRTFYLDRDPINEEERNVQLIMQCTEGLRVAQ